MLTPSSLYKYTCIVEDLPVPKPCATDSRSHLVDRQVNVLAVLLHIVGETDARYSGTDGDDFYRLELKKNRENKPHERLEG